MLCVPLVAPPWMRPVGCVYLVALIGLRPSRRVAAGSVLLVEKATKEAPRGRTGGLKSLLRREQPSLSRAAWRAVTKFGGLVSRCPRRTRSSSGADLVTIDVFVVAPVRIHRENLCGALKRAENLNVVGTAATLADATPRLLELRPQVALLDAKKLEHLDFPPSAAADPAAKLVAVGVPESEALSWIEAGVSGYVCPEASLEDLTFAIARVARGELVTSPEIAAHVLRRARKPAGDAFAVDDGRLSPREVEVLDLVAEGLSNKAIGRRLIIQEQTVKNHVHNILLKLGVHGRAEAAARVRRRER